jgi:hypothetical protein
MITPVQLMIRIGGGGGGGGGGTSSDSSTSQVRKRFVQNHKQHPKPVLFHLFCLLGSTTKIQISDIGVKSAILHTKFASNFRGDLINFCITRMNACAGCRQRFRAADAAAAAKYEGENNHPVCIVWKKLLSKLRNCDCISLSVISFVVPRLSPLPLICPFIPCCHAIFQCNAAGAC